MSETSEAQPMTETEKAHSAVSRVLNLSIFFAGVGVYAIAGFALHQIEMFAEYQMTYFAVGVAVGLVGLLLWLVTR